MLIAILLTLAGCGYMPPERIPPDVAGISITMSEKEEKTVQWWWQDIPEKELHTLIEDALQGSPTLAQVRSRLKQAEASARKDRSPLFPTLTASADVSAQRDSNHENEVSVGGASRYELDLWGRNWATFRSAVGEADAATLDVQTAMISLSAEVAETWASLIAARHKEALVEKQISINNDILELQRKRYSSGTAGALDLLQQKELAARASALLPDIQAERIRLGHQLAVLLGRAPGDVPVVENTGLPSVLSLPSGGISLTVLSDRPDLHAAWLRVRAADWAVSKAEVDRLPAMTLTGSATSSSNALNTLFDDWLVNLVAGLTLPIIDGGSRRAEVARQEAIADERLHAYRQAVLEAAQEVKDALSDELHQHERVRLVRIQLEASKAALQQAQTSYINGDASYLDVLNSLLSVQNLQRTLIDDERDLILGRIALYRATGGQAWHKGENSYDFTAATQ